MKKKAVLGARWINRCLVAFLLVICMLVIFIVGLEVGRWTALRDGGELMWIPVAGAVTIAWHPDESEAIGEWRDGELKRIWRMGDGRRYRDLERALQVREVH